MNKITKKDKRGAAAWLLFAVFWLVFAFLSNPAKGEPISMGDANGDGSVNLGDAGYIVAYILRDGPAPMTIEDHKHNQLIQSIDSLRMLIDSLDEDAQIIKSLIGAVGILDNVDSKYDPEIDPDVEGD